MAEAVERGLKRREAEGKDISTMGPVCTIMVGRVDDWLKVVADRDNIIAHPAAFAEAIHHYRLLPGLLLHAMPHLLPVFELVTGVSTGALSAPFAFLGGDRFDLIELTELEQIEQ